ncbi:hypothetical protein [Aureivirga marina]|uniref:hypothetical protein n=1 Tax=Aureivirga marina TaxID=1182451 RepID=UPI0018CB6BE4|nr:hypothetical protein [Aureivirga marina]
MKSKFIFFSILLLLCSCVTTKKATTEIQNKRKLKEVLQVKQTEISKAIFDTISFEIPVELAATIQDFSSEKKSGENQVKILKKGNKVIFQTKVAETKVEKDSIYKHKEINQETFKEKEIKKTFPYWVLWLFILFVCLIVSLFVKNKF